MYIPVFISKDVVIDTDWGWPSSIKPDHGSIKGWGSLTAGGWG